MLTRQECEAIRERWTPGDGQLDSTPVGLRAKIELVALLDTVKELRELLEDIDSWLKEPEPVPAEFVQDAIQQALE